MFRRTVKTLALLFCVSSVAFGASLAADLQNTWAQQKSMLTRTVEAMPEESFSFKPTPAQRTFGEQVLHIAGANRRTCPNRSRRIRQSSDVRRVLRHIPHRVRAFFVS